MLKIHNTLFWGQSIIKHLSTMANPVVTVTEGRVQGAIKNLLDGSPYYSFKGIRYAAPPVGKLRFKAPLPPKPFDEVFDATQHGPISPQADMMTLNIIEGSEDCLRLNIYTKTLKSDARVPVMVFIHGGAFMSGSGDDDMFGPEFIIQHDVILVTINYRLEVLGFLCLDTPEVPGNAGMKDQTAALKWIKNNIANFGGDPNNVTIFGESAGSASVTYHMLSPLSKGLFHKVIAQSGVCIQDWAIARNVRERAFKVGKNLGKETDNVDELLEFLQSVPAVNLVKQTLKTRSLDEKHRGLPFYFVPVVEKQFNIPDQFITGDPLQMLMEHKVNLVPLMIGYTSAEGLLTTPSIVRKTDFYNKHPSYFVPREVAENVSQEKLIQFGEKIKKFYFNGNISSEALMPITDLLTDLHFLYNIHRFSDIYVKSNGPVYLYRFDFSTQLNILKNMLDADNCEGASHADDIFYLFKNPLNQDIYEENKELQKIVHDVTKIWTDFAKTGTPVADTSTTQWPPYSRSGREYFNINRSWAPATQADKHRVEFWNKIYCEAGRPCITNSHL